MRKVDILVYVEDPGAANYVSRFPSIFTEKGWTVVLLAEGLAYSYLVERGAQAVSLTRPVTAEHILSEWAPKLVIVGTAENPDTFAFELISSSRKAGIATIGVIDAIGNADYRFRGNTGDALHHAPDWLIVPDQWTQDAYITLGYPAERIAVCGHPHHDLVFDTRTRLEKIGREQLRKKIFPDCHDARLIVVFVSEVSTGLNPNQYKRSPDYTLTGDGGRMDRTGIVLEEFLGAIASFEQSPYLVLRMHPKNTENELESFLKDFDYVSQQGGPLELVFVADLVVGMTTMLLQEAAIMGRPTLSIVPRSVETKSLPTVRAGITPCVTTREELRQILPGLMRGQKNDIKTRIEALFQYGSQHKTGVFVEGLLTRKWH
jgi:hypothetical protein